MRYAYISPLDARLERPSNRVAYRRTKFSYRVIRRRIVFKAGPRACTSTIRRAVAEVPRGVSRKRTPTTTHRDCGPCISVPRTRIPLVTPCLIQTVERVTTDLRNNHRWPHRAYLGRRTFLFENALFVAALSALVRRLILRRTSARALDTSAKPNFPVIAANQRLRTIIRRCAGPGGSLGVIRVVLLSRDRF